MDLLAFCFRNLPRSNNLFQCLWNSKYLEFHTESSNSTIYVFLGQVHMVISIYNFIASYSNKISSNQLVLFLPYSLCYFLFMHKYLIIIYWGIWRVLHICKKSKFPICKKQLYCYLFILMKCTECNRKLVNVGTFIPCKIQFHPKCLEAHNNMTQARFQMS